MHHHDMPTSDRSERVNSVIRQAQLDGERSIGLFRVGVTVALGALILLTISANQWRASADDWWNIIATITGFGAGVTAVVLSRRGWYRVWFSYAVTIVDIVLISIALWTAQFGENASLSSIVQVSSFSLYAVAIAFTMRRLDTRNTLFATALSVGLYVAMLVAVGRAGLFGTVLTAEIEGSPAQRLEINLINEVIRVASLIMVGAVSYGITRAQARLFDRGLSAEREIERVTTTFGRYVSADLAGRLLETDIAVAGEEREATVVFIDIVGFTSATERLDPAQVFTAINIFVASIIDLANEHSGFINKFIGDAVMLVFGAPVAGDGHQRRALAFATDLALRGPYIRREIARRGIDWAIEFGIGVNTGPVMLGTIGNDSRAEYTAIGDAVNVASRLEKEVHLNREHGPLLAGESTVAAVVGTEFRAVGSIQVRGRTEPLNVFALSPELVRQSTGGG